MPKSDGGGQEAFSNLVLIAEGVRMKLLYRMMIFGSILALAILTYSVITLKHNLDAEREKRSNLQSQLEARQSDLEKALAVLDTNEKQISKLTSDLEKIKDHNVQLNKNIKELNSSVENSAELIKKKDQAIQEKDSELNKFKKKLKESEAKVAKKKDVSTTQSTKSKSLTGKVASVSRSSASPKGKTMTMEATAYTAYCTGCSGITKTGVNLRANPNLKLIAVDPSVIPLGSKVHVEGYGYAIAGDTGGAIKGSRIDLHYPNKSSANDFGRRNVKVTIIN